MIDSFSVCHCTCRTAPAQLKWPSYCDKEAPPPQCLTADGDMKHNFTKQHIMDVWGKPLKVDPQKNTKFKYSQNITVSSNLSCVKHSEDWGEFQLLVQFEKKDWKRVCRHFYVCAFVGMRHVNRKAFTYSLTLFSDDLRLHLPLRSSIWRKKIVSCIRRNNILGQLAFTRTLCANICPSNLGNLTLSSLLPNHHHVFQHSSETFKI